MMAKGMMTLKEIEDAGHLDCMMEAAVTNALEHLDKIHFKQFANMQFEINMQSRGE
jgi:hypothetical protein